MTKDYNSQGQEIKQATKEEKLNLPANVVADLERIQEARIKLKKHKGNCLFQTKQIYVHEQFLVWDAANLEVYKKKVEYLEKQISDGETRLVTSKKSLEFSSNYICVHGDDEDKASIAEAILKKIKKLRIQQAELQNQYDEQLAKESKK